MTSLFFTALNAVCNQGSRLCDVDVFICVFENILEVLIAKAERSAKV